MDKKKYLDELFWEISYGQLLSMYMYCFYNPKDLEHKKDTDSFENELKEKLLQKWKNEEEIKVWIQYLKQIAEEKMQDWL